MNSLALTLLCTIPIFTANPLHNPELFGRDQVLCKSLNQSLNYDHDHDYDPTFGMEDTLIRATFKFPVNFQDIEQEVQEEFVVKHFSFRYAFRWIHTAAEIAEEEPVLNITTNVPRNIDLQNILLKGDLSSIFPFKYNITKFHTPDPDFTPYFLIQGERCSIEYNEENNQLYNKRCWSKPGFCRGPILYCLLNDSENSLCYDALTGEGFRDENPRRIPYSFFIGELIHWRIHERYLFDDWADGPWTFSWNCTEFGDDILCDCLDDRPRPSLLVLKTMAGYSG